MAAADQTTRQLRRPLFHLVFAKVNRSRYLTQCIPLHKAALKGDWKEAKKILDQDRTLLTSAITQGWGTVLHIAVGADHVHFVEKLVKIMRPRDLELQDDKGNTAFWVAAGVGNVHIAEIMREKNNLLPQIRGGEGITPLHFAVLERRREMAWYLFPMSINVFQYRDWVSLFFSCINSAFYDLALEVLNEDDTVALERGDNNETGLHILARTPLDHSFQSRTNLLHFCTKDTPVLDLIKRMWTKFLTLDNANMMETIRNPYSLTSIAAEVGNFEFLSVVMSTYPELIWELNAKGQSVIHIAALHRHVSIFNLIHEIGPMKGIILTFADDEGNNLLHCVAKLAPPDRLNIVSGAAAVQMMLELSWFEEVKKIMQVRYLKEKNSEGLTPPELFTKEHAKLHEKAEFWMEKTATSCIVVSTLIATGVFSAAFSLPGGNNDNTRTPNYLEKPLFLVFALSDATALISSSTSILIFLSILISRYTQDDFLKSVPLKLISGLIALFISVISMMVAFSSAFFITFYNGARWVPCFISGLAFLPIPLFIYLQFSLWSDIVYSAYICNSLFRSRKCMIH